MIFCIIGKTGVGKTTLAKSISRNLHIPIIVSYTSRPKRKKEKDEEDYFFVDHAYFDKHKNEFIDLREYTVKNGEIWEYGINKKQINKKKDYIAVVDTEGYKNLSKHFRTKALIIDSYDDIIIDRLSSRGDDPEEIQRRLEDDKAKIDDFMTSTSIDQRTIIYNNDSLISAEIDCAQSILMTLCDDSYRKSKRNSIFTTICMIASLLCFIFDLLL